MSLFRTVSLLKVSTREGQYVKGKWVPGTSVETAFNGTWQPASGKVLETLPEEKRNKDTYICYAPIDMEFTSADPETQVAGDCIKWENKLYEITTASKWNNAVLPHWELVCVRKKEGEK